ncbi:2,2-dialkylglycine decarboxylase [bacterium HR33]|nr:2,2-dialkylglycine decarboxylase [bacterium HR33]
MSGESGRLFTTTPAAVGAAPQFSPREAGELLRRLYAMDGSLEPLPSERDQNFAVLDRGRPCFVLKIANPLENASALEAQDAALKWVISRDPSLGVPRPIADRHGNTISRTGGPDGKEYLVRLLAWVPGSALASVERHHRSLLKSLGWMIGRLDAALEGFDHPGLYRELHWDLSRGLSTAAANLAEIDDANSRALAARLLEACKEPLRGGLEGLRAGAIHNDFNDHNVLVQNGRVSGVVDFGDMIAGKLVFDPAIAIAYALIGKEDLVGTAKWVLEGYQEIIGLEPQERELLPELITLRLLMSVAISAKQRKLRPDDDYLTVSEKGAWDVLRLIDKLGLERIRSGLAKSLWRDKAMGSSPGSATERVLAVRREHFGRGLRLHYKRPLHIVRGWMQYLYGADGREYLDLVNNVCHVGHCHPKVVEAAHRQWSQLNTNTRYLYDELADYLERLLALFPEPLKVCYLVCSGSEANELALRLARAYTGRRDVMVLDHAYHGNTTTLVEISPYKYKGKGGAGRPDWVHEVELPDTYRGRWRDPKQAGEQYAARIREALSRQGAGERIAAFICESVPGCAGQVVLPEGYLAAAYRAVREAGAVCIADEVQVGFGRVGNHAWAFQTQGVIPDIVTLGKPIGNGHPLAAVITRSEIAEAFDNGMEYFNTFGGNPVSCAVGLAVLDVMEEEGLQERARVLGDRLLKGLRSLAEHHEAIGDVRGLGLFVGVDLVRDRESREPDPALAEKVVERLKERGILVNTEGPGDNVLKIKPPLQINEADIDRFLEELDGALRGVDPLASAVSPPNPHPQRG